VSHEPAIAELGATAPIRTPDVADVDIPVVTKLFRSTGLILFRGLDLDLPRFRALTERFCTDFVSYAGGGTARPLHDGDPTMMAVAEAGHHYPTPLHSEMSYTSDRPLVLWFYCQRPAREAGETTVADGVRFASELSPATRELFETRGLRYVLKHPDGRWQSIFQTDDLDEVRRICDQAKQSMRVEEDGTVIQESNWPAFIPAHFGGEPSFANGTLTQLQWEADGGQVRFVRLGDGNRIPAPVVAEIRGIETDLTRDVAWQPGDVVMIDNTRMLHGRRGHSDPKRAISLRMARRLGA
jgi:alpha-ketoglutarate-dependent taurine dioxygenase